MAWFADIMNYEIRYILYYMSVNSNFKAVSGKYQEFQPW